MNDTSQPSQIDPAQTDPSQWMSTETSGSDNERSLRQMIWRRFKQHKLGLTGLFVILALVVVFLFAGFFSPYHYLEPHYGQQYVPPMLTRIHFDGFQPFVYGLDRQEKTVEINGTEVNLPGVWDYQEDTSERYYIHFFTSGNEYQLLGFIPTDIHLFGTNTPPSSDGQLFLLGTDSNGRDMLSRALYAGRVTLGLAPLVILLSYLLGSLLGGLSGYLGGWIDTLMQRITEIFMSLPRLAVLITILGGILADMGSVDPMLRFWIIAGILALINWSLIARVIRGQFLTLREAEYTQAAKAVGSGNMRIITRHIMPNVMSYLVVSATLAIPDIIILESILSFLGYGIENPLLSWGAMLQNFALQGVFQEMQFHPWMLIPAAFIVLTVLAFNFLGDALRDAVDPYTVVSGDGGE